MGKESKSGKADKSAAKTGLARYEATCHVVVKSAGHLYAPTDENVAAGLPSRCVLLDADAKPYGDALKRIGDAKANDERNKMVTDTIDK